MTSRRWVLTIYFCSLDSFWLHENRRQETRNDTKCTKSARAISEKMAYSNSQQYRGDNGEDFLQLAATATESKIKTWNYHDDNVVSDVDLLFFILFCHVLNELMMTCTLYLSLGSANICCIFVHPECPVAYRSNALRRFFFVRQFARFVCAAYILRKFGEWKQFSKGSSYFVWTECNNPIPTSSASLVVFP